MVEWTYVIMETVYFVFGTLAMINTLRDWKENKNRILIAIAAYMGVVLLNSIINYATYLANLNLDIVVTGYVTVGNIIGNLLFIIQLEFMFFLKRLNKLYTLPLIISFYIIFGRILVDSSMPFILYAMIVSYSSAYVLIRDGRKRHNGLAIGMGLFFLLWGLGQTIGPNTIIIFLSFRIAAIIALYLGTRGFYEKYVWPNQAVENRVQNTWITKLVVKE